MGIEGGVLWCQSKQKQQELLQEFLPSTELPEHLLVRSRGRGVPCRCWLICFFISLLPTAFSVIVYYFVRRVLSYPSGSKMCVQVLRSFFDRENLSHTLRHTAYLSNTLLGQNILSRNKTMTLKVQTSID